MGDPPGKAKLPTTYPASSRGTTATRGMKPSPAVSGILPTSSTDSSRSSSSSLEDITHNKKSKKTVKPKHTSDLMPKKLADIQNVIASKKDQIIQHAEPTVTRLQVALVAQKQELRIRTEPYRNRIIQHLGPVNIFLRRFILDADDTVKEVEDWLNDTLPDQLLNWFAPIPEDEKEPFKIHKPSGLSIVFFALNLALLFVGFLVFFIGASALVNPSAFNSLTKKYDPTGRLKNSNVSGLLGSATLTFIFYGAFLLGLGYLGTIGCILGQRQMLRAYAAIVSIIIAVQALAALFAFLDRSSIYHNVAEDLKATIKDSYDGTANSTSAFSQLWDLVQFYFSCCGVLNYTDFAGSPWYRAANKPKTKNGSEIKPTIVYQFPMTCCEALVDHVPDTKAQLSDSQCQEKNASLKNANTVKPCLKAISSWFIRKSFVLLGALLSFVGLEVSLITNALAIVQMIDKFYAKRRKRREKEKRKKKGKHTGKRGRRKKGHAEKQNDDDNDDDDDRDVEKATDVKSPSQTGGEGTSYRRSSLSFFRAKCRVESTPQCSNPTSPVRSVTSAACAEANSMGKAEVDTSVMCLKAENTGKAEVDTSVIRLKAENTGKAVIDTSVMHPEAHDATINDLAPNDQREGATKQGFTKVSEMKRENDDNDDDDVTEVLSASRDVAGHIPDHAPAATRLVQNDHTQQKQTEEHTDYVDGTADFPRLKRAWFQEPFDNNPTFEAVDTTPSSPSVSEVNPMTTAQQRPGTGSGQRDMADKAGQKR